MEVVDKINNVFDNISIKSFSIKEEGVVIDVNSSIVIGKGFTNIKSEECVLIKNRYHGIVSVIENDIIKIILLDKTDDIVVGDKIIRTYEPLKVPVSDNMIGRILNGLGTPIDDGETIKADEYYDVERPAKGIIERQSVKEPLETGIKVVDSLIPIGKGQRELILGDKQTGKTSIAIDTILHQKNSGVVCIYCCIGQRDNNVANVIKILKDNDAMKYTIVVHASSSELSGMQYIAPYTATSIAEYFMEKGKDVLIVYDDLTKHARAYREISLLLEKNPGREAFPADIFYIHSRLLERSTRLRDDLGGGSITSLPIVETEAENISAYIPTNVISITDGQIYLSPHLFQKGILPAIDIGKSVSRVGSSAQLVAYKQAVGTLGIQYAQFEELEMFSKFSTSLDTETQKLIDHGRRIREVFKQNVSETYSAEEQIAIFLSINNGVFENISVDKVRKAELIIKNTINNDFKDVVELVRNNKKIPQDLIDNFIFKVKEKVRQIA